MAAWSCRKSFVLFQPVTRGRGGGLGAEGLQFVPLEPALEREVFMMTRGDRALNSSARALEAAITAGLARNTAPQHSAGLVS